MRMRHARLGSTASPARLRSASDAAIAVGIALALFLPLTAADLYLSADRRSGILPVNATIISFIALSSVFGVIFLVGLARDRGRRLCSMYLAVGPVLLAFSLLTIAQLVGGFLPKAYWFGSGKFIYLPLYSLVLLFFSVGIASSPAFQRYHRVILVGCLLGAAGSILIDAIYPETFARYAFRPAGFHKDSNHSAMIVVILAIAAVDWTRSRTGDMLLWLIAGLAVVATLSRGGMILLAVAFLHYSIVSWRLGPQRYAKNLSMLLAAAAIIVPLYFLSGSGTTTYSSENARVRQLAALLSGDTASLATDSRVQLVLRYLDLISDRPILGYGTGLVMTDNQGPHNMFLTLWVENGVLGLSAYLMVLIVCFRYFQKMSDSRGQAFCLALFVFSFFSHNLFATRPIYVTVGLLSAMAVSQALAGSEPARSAAAPRFARSSRLAIRRPRLTITPSWFAPPPPYRRD